MATFEQWLVAYSSVYESVPQDSGAACPNCGHRALRLVFTGDPERMIGYAHFWCDNCLHGIGISRAPIPVGAVMQDIRQPPAGRVPKIPNFRIVS
jgi:hypothetical protein